MAPELHTPPLLKMPQSAPSFHFKLSELLTPREMDAHGGTPWGPVALFDTLNGPPLHGAESLLCPKISQELFGGCGANCKIRAQARNLGRADQITQAECRAGTLSTVVPIRLGGNVSGYLFGPDLVGLGFPNESLRRLPEAVQEKLRHLADRKPDPELYRRYLIDKARLLEQIASERFRKKVVEEGTRGVESASSDSKLFDQLFRTAVALFGPKVEFGVGKVAPVLRKVKLVSRRGVNMERHPDLVDLAGHVEQVHSALSTKRYTHPLYEPFLQDGDLSFRRIPGVLPPVSVFTIGLYVDGEPLVVQLHLPFKDGFSDEDREVYASVVSSVRDHRRPIPTLPSLPIEPQGKWRSAVREALLNIALEPTEVLRERRKLQKAFVEELYSSAGDGVIAVSIRLLNGRDSKLAFAAVYGQWTDKMKAHKYRLDGNSAGARAFRDGRYYIRDVNDGKHYFEQIMQTRSLWCHAFSVDGKPVGVVSVDWDSIDGLRASEPYFIKLLDEFQQVMNAITKREREAFYEFDTYSTDDQASNERKVTLLNDLFQAGRCRLFLGEDLTLIATSEPSAPEASSPSGVSVSAADSRLPMRVGANDAKRYANSLDRATLSVPLVDDNLIFGVLEMQGSRELAAFEWEDETLLLHIAERIAKGIHRYQIELEASRKLTALEQAREAEAKSRAAQHPREAAEILLDVFMQQTFANGAYLAWGDLHCGSGFVKLLIAEGLQPEPPKEELFSGEPLPSFAGFLPTGLARYASSIASLPLPAEPEAHVLFCWDEPGKRFNEDLRRELRSIASRLRAVLKPTITHLLTSQTLSYLQELAIQFSQLPVLERVADRVQEAMLEVSGMEFATVRVLDDSSDTWRLASKNDDGDAFPEKLEHNQFVELIQGVPRYFYCKDTSDWRVWELYLKNVSRLRGDHLKKIRTWCGVPLRFRDEFFGFVALESTTPSALTEEKLEHLCILAEYAASALGWKRQHSQLELAINMAEPFALLGKMLSGFLHEVRNRAIAMGSNLEVATHQNAQKQDRDSAMSRISTSLDALTELCNDLEHFSDGGGRVRKPIDLIPFLDQVLRDWRERSPRDTTIRLRISKNLDHPHVLGNQLELGIALKMLLQNAFEALRDSVGGTKIAGIRLVARGSDVVIQVGDSGPGMDVETTRRCFEPFFSTKKEKGGTGLGMAVAKGIVSRHHGHIDIASKKGRGTVVSVILPMANRSKECTGHA
jgi:signal transduction histidine kinase/putative methionine-R-sulfoxide reductase with GAF domain